MTIESGGAIDIGSGVSAIAGAIHVGGLGSLTGAGTIDGNLVDDGNVTVTAGQLVVTGDISGSGFLFLDDGATLEAGGTVSQAITFSGDDTTLKVEQPSGLTGTLDGLAAGDTVDLVDTIATSATVSGTNLTVDIQGSAPLSYTVGSLPSHSQFIILGDGHGGSELVVEPTSVIQWTSPSSGDWFVSSNWNNGSGGLPTSTSDVVIGLSPGVLTPITVTIDNSGAAFASLDVRAGVTLDIDATIDNVGGVISANGGNVNLQSAFITGGTLETSNGGVFNIVNNHSVFDGTGGNTVSSTGNVDVDNNGLLVLQGAIDNTGTIALDSTGNSTTLQFDISGATLSGGGVVTMSDSPGNNYIQGNGQNGGTAGTDVLTNVNNTIEGVGTIGGNGLGLVNDGTIDANVSGATLIINNQGNNSPNSSEAGTVGNAGTLEATGSGTLLIQQTAIDNVGGVILANGGNVNLQSAFITGGALETFDGGVINIVNNGSVFDGTGGNTVSVTGNVDVDDNGLLVLQGAIDNTNTIALDSSGHSTTLQLDISGATLSGGGVVTMSPGDNYIQGNGQNGGAAGTDVLTNLSNTIEGVGTIGGNGMGLVNKSGGTIDADVSGATLIINNQGNNSPNSSEAGTVSNAGMLEATNSATLLISANRGRQCWRRDFGQWRQCQPAERVHHRRHA